MLLPRGAGLRHGAEEAGGQSLEGRAQVGTEQAVIIVYFILQLSELKVLELLGEFFLKCCREGRFSQSSGKERWSSMAPGSSFQVLEAIFNACVSGGGWVE